MKRRARRGRGRGGRKTGNSYVEVAPEGVAEEGVESGMAHASPGLSEDTEVEDGTELALELQDDPTQPQQQQLFPDDGLSSNSGDGVEASIDHINETITDVIAAVLPGPAPVMVGLPAISLGCGLTSMCSAPVSMDIAPASSGSSHSSLDGDGCHSDGSNPASSSSDGPDNEEMHSGFLQTGPNKFRVGSTMVNLNNSSEDGLTPEFRQKDICLQVECGDNKALMYLSKLYQGSKGKCIEMEGRWLTPNEFQAISGRESAKDWKRSIRHHGRSLKLLLSKNVLDVHPAACRCDSCSQLQQLNGKIGPTVDASKGGGGDTSSEDNRRSCNGTPGGIKKKKGKQNNTAVTKMAKMTAAATANTTTTKLEPIGITIPKTPEEPKEEDKVLDIPNMDSPLFKDVPSKKKADSSSDSSSSSGDTSSSDDSSSSDEDSEEEDDDKKDLKMLNSSQKTEVPEEPPKARTPIKLTISNLGKPSAKVTSTASREPVDSNSSDSDTDVDDPELIKGLKGHTNLCIQNSVPHVNNIPVVVPEVDPTVVRLDTSVAAKGPGQNHIAWNNFDMDVKELKDFSSVKDINSSSLMSLNCLLNSAAEDKATSNRCLDLSAVGDSFIFKEAAPVSVPRDPPELFKKELLVADVGSEVMQQTSFSDKDNHFLSLAKDIKSPPEMNSALLRDSLETKYCPDGFILSPTLSKSPQHLKATVRASQPAPSLEHLRDDQSFSISRTDTIPRAECLSSLDVRHKPQEQESLQSSPEGNFSLFLKDTKSNSPTSYTSLHTDGVRDTPSNRSSSVKEFSEDIADVYENNKDQNLNVKMNTANSSDDSSDKLPISMKTDPVCVEPSPSVHKGGVEPALCLDPPVVSLAMLKNSTTKAASFSSNGGMAPSIKHKSKSSGFTNGIPDSENPFITWTKYDDDDSGPVGSTLPTSSIVQALARGPFPPLALSGESPLPQISPLGAVPQLSPLGLAGLSPGSSQVSRMSPGSQLPRLSSPTSSRLKMSPGHSTAQPQASPHGRLAHAGQHDGTKVAHGEEKVKTTQNSQKSIKRTSRLSNIIDSLRTSKEKEAASGSQSPGEVGKKSGLDSFLGSGKKSPLPEPSTLSQKSAPASLSTSSSIPSSIFPASLASDPKSQSERHFRDSLGYPHTIGLDAQQAAYRSSLEAARAHSINSSFNAFKDDIDKGKRMLENLEMMKNGMLDPFNKTGLPDPKSRKVDSSQSQTRSKPSLPSSSSSSSSAAVSSASSVTRPSSRQSSKPTSQAYPSTSPSSSLSSSSTSARTSTVTTTSNSFGSAAAGSSMNSAMFQAAPSAALAAAHMELNAAAANILAFQHMYGMQDPYMMKTLMSNPLYLQRMMEFQKQAMDPLMLRQLEMFEAAAAAEKSKSKDQRAALNAQSLLWQAQAASILQHQQMQQFQHLQLHHQQLQQQAAAVRERETRETIAAIMANKTNSLGTHTNKSSGSISTGQSAKSLMASASTLAQSSSSSSSASSSNKRPRTSVPQSPSDLYSRDSSSLEKKARPSQQSSSSHLSNHNNYHPSSSTSSSSSNVNSSSSASKNMQVPSKSAGSVKQRSNSSTSTPSLPSKPAELFDFSSALQLSAATGSPNFWGFPTVIQPPSVDLARMSRFFERPNEASSSLSSSSSSAGPVETEAPGAEVLDLSVKPRAGKT